jgi:regulatory protein
MAWATRKQFTLEDGKSALDRYCAYQERCQKEVQTKIAVLGFRGEAAEVLLLEALQSDWVNDERFARAYARGKFRALGWGKGKILYGLRSKGISSGCIDLGLQEIDPQEYEEKALAVAARVWEDVRKLPAVQQRRKVEQVLYQRGFESEWAARTAPGKEEAKD